MTTTDTSVYDFTAQTLDGKPASLADFRGKVILIVNTASKCGFTPQFAGLEALYETYKDRGLVVLGFPCNQFGAQEPGNAEEIASFCKLTYDVTFPMMAKIDVNGPNAHPLYVWLKSRKKGLFGSEGIKWNFTKFLVSRQGEVVGRFGPMSEPKSLEKAIEAAL
jgi:glutathione peroxidase